MLSLESFSRETRPPCKEKARKEKHGSTHMWREREGVKKHWMVREVERQAEMLEAEVRFPQDSKTVDCCGQGEKDHSRNIPPRARFVYSSTTARILTQTDRSAACLPSSTGEATLCPTTHTRWSLCSGFQAAMAPLLARHGRTLRAFCHRVGTLLLSTSCIAMTNTKK